MNENKTTKEILDIIVEIKKEWVGGNGSSVYNQLSSYDNMDVFSKLDQDGIIKDGEMVKPGDVILAALKPSDQGDTLLNFLNLDENSTYKLHKETIPQTGFAEGKVTKRTIVSDPSGNIKQRVRLTITN